MTRRSVFAFCAVMLSILADAAMTASRSQGLGAERRPDRAYGLGRDGWSLERFGDHVAILRTGVTPGPDAPGAPGLLVLSCDAGERRWRLSLPERLPAEQVSATTMLLRPPSPAADYRVETVRVTEGRLIAFAEKGAFSRGGLPFFVRLLKSGTRRIELLLRSDGAKRGAQDKAGFAAVLLYPTVQRTDLLAFDDFLASCAAQAR